MGEVARNIPSSDPSASLVHVVNSSLLRFLFGHDGLLAPILIDSSAWIINVLYVCALPDSTTILKTSSTLHRGNLCDDQSGASLEVLGIDETVPLSSSVSGRCVLTGRPIWLSDSALAVRKDRFGERFYRRFSLVDVKTDGYMIPQAEIVFPISLRSMSASSVLGVLNMELFTDHPFRSSEYLHQLPQESIDDFLVGLLQVHAAYLRIGTDFASLESEDTPRRQNAKVENTSLQHREKIAELHSAAMKMYSARHGEQFAEFIDVIKSTAADFRGRLQGTFDER